MGEVCLADDLLLDRRVALKFLISPDGEGQSLEQLLGEARAAASLDHPFICKIFEVTELGGRPCIVMEYVCGDTLERRLRRGPLPVAEMLRLAEEIAEALEAAHKRRLVHRDLKPANVIVTDDGHIKVMDFGIAVRMSPAVDGADADASAAIDGRRHVSAFFGTPAYMAPEQLHGAAVDRRSDIFAFGVLLYELLSGTQPVPASGLDATLAAILSHDAGRSARTGSRSAEAGGGGRRQDAGEGSGRRAFSRSATCVWNCGGWLRALAPAAADPRPPVARRRAARPRGGRSSAGNPSSRSWCEASGRRPQDEAACC